ncbi:hypothetical protein Syun_031705 [Stephania yunnanensis]|uniref:Uncharacterized protein n=1 Tax=Stephania yunnanensis TaxID=152371 RepID=A0AAP0DZN4_9MAGN
MLPLSPDSLSLSENPISPKHNALSLSRFSVSPKTLSPQKSLYLDGRYHRSLSLTALSVTAPSHGPSTAHRSLSPESHSPSTLSLSHRDLSLLQLRLRRGLPSPSVESAIGLGIWFEEGRTDRYASGGGLRSLGVAYQEVPDGTKDNPGGPWEFVGLLPLFDPPRHDSAETIRKALDLRVSVKMITGDQLAIAKETGRRLGMGANMYPSTSLLGEQKDGSIPTLPIDELIEKADGFAGVFPGWRYYFSLLLEFSDITMPMVRTIFAKVSDGISFFLVCLIGRSLELIYKGIRQSLADSVIREGQLILLGKASDDHVQRDFEGLTNLFHYQVDKFSFPILLLSPLHFLFYNVKRLQVE